MAEDSDVNLSNLTNAIVQCFTIILFGYIAGRAGIISSVQGSGIGAFTSKFCLPALIFRSMCSLDFSSVDWMFLLGIFLAKAFLFTLVCLATLAIKRPVDRGLAGIFAIFSIQSNDFAFGYPIIEAIYGETHPEYVNYLYLFAPISLAILNPIGFILMEFQNSINSREEEGNHMKFGAVLKKVLKDIALNPIVNMTIIGIAANFILGGSLPAVLDDILVVLDNAFSAGALFFLGLSLVGKVQGRMGKGLLVPFLLVGAKTLLLPLFAWGIVQQLDTSNSSSSLSMYGFLYGTIPTTPSVYIFANDFGFGQDIIATSLVLGTALSAPFMFISAKMMTMVVDSSTDYDQMLYETSFDIGIVSIVGCVWVMILFIFTGKWRRVPHRFTMAFMATHMLGCLGAIMYYNDNSTKSDGVLYASLVMLMLGVFASRAWTAILATVLCLLHVKSLCYVLKIQTWLFFIGFGVPMVLTGLLFIVGNESISDEIDPTFHYGDVQAIFSLGALVVSFSVTATALIWWQREDRNHHTIRNREQSVIVQGNRHTYENSGFSTLNTNLGSGSNTPQSPGSPRFYGSNAAHHSRDTDSESGDGDQARGTATNGTVTLRKAPSIEDILPFGTDKPEVRSNSNSPEQNLRDFDSNSMLDDVSERTCLLGQCTPRQRHACVNMIRTYVRTSLDPDTLPTVEVGERAEESNVSVGQLMMEEYQSFSHLLLLLPLIFSMFVAIVLCTWKIFNEEISGIYIEVEFLDIALNYGQGILVLLVFGFESKIIFSPLARRFIQLLRRVRRAVFGSEILRLPQLSDLDPETKQHCKQFTKYHLENCRKEIVRDRRLHGQTVKDVFTGTAMCDWLINSGLVPDRSSAVEYGCHLILGRVIAHMTGEHNFHDITYFYRFQDTYEQLSV